MNDLIKSSDPEINVTNHGHCISYSADADAVKRIKSLSDAEFEKEISGFDSGMQTFLRMARNK